MIVDLVMGLTAVTLGLLLTAYSSRLADLLQEGDDRWREEHPWVQAFEPQVGPLATDRGRWWILRSWLLVSSFGFCVVGFALVGRAAL
jgi:hypothetical protein